MDDLKIDKTAFSVADLHDPGDEKAYWLSKTPQERLLAMQIMREILYGRDAATGRLERILEIAER
ncbi:MAG TPA: hypothetical protein PLP19_20905 [bacterium]|nr:hypothetical protein [bacterium]HPN45956.1 hypothetical protein [bacterium]